ncbi:MAG: M3 family metallopeptidase [Alistipes indistinctus]
MSNRAARFDPLISIVCNFTKPTDRQPSLLTFNEVTTLLHEFGHALHEMLACGRYPALTGTNVYRDFAELPSQLMENWATEKEFLDLPGPCITARGEDSSPIWCKKIVDAKNFQAAAYFAYPAGIRSGSATWRGIRSPHRSKVVSPNLSGDAIGKAQLLPYVAGQCMATAFGHIFSGGYAAGYYGYKWAEVLDADAFSLFSGAGVFSIRTWRKHSGRISWKRRRRASDDALRAVPGART